MPELSDTNGHQWTQRNRAGTSKGLRLLPIVLDSAPCNHQINRENGNPFFGHTWSIANFPAPVKNSVIPPASSTRSNSLPFQPFAGIWTQNIATNISIANRSPSHLVAQPKTSSMPPISSRTAITGPISSGNGIEILAKNAEVLPRPAANFA